MPGTRTHYLGPFGQRADIALDEVNDKLTGFIDGSNTFLAGASLASRTDFIWDEESKNWYYWSGVLPKDVPAASSPDSTGGVGPGAWIGVGDASLRSMLASSDGTSLIHHKGQNTTDAPLNKYLAWRNGDISAFGGKYDDSAAGALNKTAFAEMESTFGGVRLNLMGKSVYLPDDMNLQVSSLDIWGGGEYLLVLASVL
ncbi:TPA: hypothetical protein ACOEHL_002243 [Enterobacter hormaechei subsp. xiangfangensis]